MDAVAPAASVGCALSHSVAASAASVLWATARMADSLAVHGGSAFCRRFDAVESGVVALSGKRMRAIGRAVNRPPCFTALRTARARFVRIRSVVEECDAPSAHNDDGPVAHGVDRASADVGVFNRDNSFTFTVDKTAIGGLGQAGGDFRVLAASQSVYQPRVVWFATSEQEEKQYVDRAINASIAGVVAAVVVAKILTVDRDYWRGWTVIEILKYAPIHNWFAYEESLKDNPILSKMMISGTVYSLGDWIAQCYEGKPLLDFNRTRMLRSGLVGFCLHGSLSHFYYYLCEALFPFKGWWVVPLKVAFDQTIWSGVWNSIYYVILGLLRFESPASIFSELNVTFWRMLTAGWKLWPFAHVITYGVIPVEQRLLWVDMVELVWVTVLSMYSNEKAEARLLEMVNETAKEVCSTGSESEDKASETCE